MHPGEQFEAFAALVAEGRPVEDIAAGFGVTPLVAQRRLKLANVSPRLLADYRAGAVTLDQLMALAITDDHAAQRLGVSRRHLDALFARSGRTVSRAIRDCRLQRVAAQLRSPARHPTGIAELGYSLGFQDPAHFARAFRRRFGAWYANEGGN